MIKKWKPFEPEKVKITKWAYAFKGYRISYNI